MNNNCTHPRAFVRKIAAALWRCDGCGEWRGSIDFGAYCDMLYPPQVPLDYARRVVNGEPAVGKAPTLPPNWRTMK